MLQWAKDHLYIRSSDEWSYDALDADPLVHLLVGACASEAEKVYTDIQASDDRLTDRLLRYLLPEAFHLPQPAVAIAKALPRTNTCLIPNHQSLVFRDSEKEIPFTPLFDVNLINGAIRYIGTDTHIIKQGTGPQYLVKEQTQTVSRLLLGIKTKDEMEAVDHLSFYINWKGDSSERRDLLLALSKSKWFCNGKPLKKQNGFNEDQLPDWKNHFDPEKKMEKKIDAQFKLNFLNISDLSFSTKPDKAVSEVLKDWLHQNRSANDKGEAVITQWEEDETEGNFIWLEIELPYSIQLTDIDRHLTFALNHFIVVNRQLEIKDDNDTYFSQSLGLEVVEINPEERLFHSISEVTNQIEGESVPSVGFSELIKKRTDTVYSFRMGGVGRFDDYNAWKRLFYLVKIFRQEHKLRDLYDRLADKMSLEELHEAIGSKISKTEAKEADGKKGSTPFYLFVQPGKSKDQLRVKVTYWITHGELANGLSPGTALLPEPSLAGIETTGITLVTSPNGGKNFSTPTEKKQTLQDVLFRRDRIVSALDIKSYCHRVIGKSLKEVNLKPFFETNRDPNEGGIKRAMEVSLMVEENADMEYITQLGQEIELNLKENSVGTMPYRVRIVEMVTT